MSQNPQSYYTITPTPNNGSSWQPEATTNNKIQMQTGPLSNWQYRQYMQQNANNIMKYNSMEAIASSGNNPYSVSNKVPSSNVPYMFNSTHDSSKPNYGFNNSDLKQEFITKQQYNSRMIAPTIPTNF